MIICYNKANNSIIKTRPKIKERQVPPGKAKEALPGAIEAQIAEEIFELPYKMRHAIFDRYKEINTIWIKPGITSMLELHILVSYN